ncbi:MAG: hypothetical protein VW577_04150, partial [Pelagibacteraceae bacterium]
MIKNNTTENQIIDALCVKIAKLQRALEDTQHTLQAFEYDFVKLQFYRNAAVLRSLKNVNHDTGG